MNYKQRMLSELLNLDEKYYSLKNYLDTHQFVKENEHSKKEIELLEEQFKVMGQYKMILTERLLLTLDNKKEATN